MVDLTKLSKVELTRQLQAMLQDKSAVDENTQQRLIHELRVHQIELEMQNRQLQETQQQLEASRDHYSELYDLAPVGYVSLTDKGVIEQINLVGATLLGKPREQLTGLPLSIFVYGPDRPEFFNYLKKVFDSNDRVNTELRLQKSGQVDSHVYVKCIAVRNTIQKITTCRCAIMNISELKKAEEQLQIAYDEMEQRIEQRTTELKQANEQLRAEFTTREEVAKELRESEARYRQVVDSQSELICRFIPSNIITFANESYCRYFKKTRKELIGRNFMSFIPMQDHAAIKAHLASLNRENPSGTFEHQVITPAGDIRWQRWTNQASFDEQGQVIEFQSVGKDVTERRQAESELEHYQKHLEDMVAMRTAELEIRNREMESFSYAVAHDLRTPLRAITSYSQVLLLDSVEKLNEDEINSLNRIIAAGKYMAQLIDDILNLAKISRNELHLETVDISAQCQFIIKILNQNEPQRNVTWKIAPGIKVWADRKAVSLIVDNLLENAWKFTRDKPDPCIEVGSTNERGKDVLYVRDNGSGFDMQYANRLFREFERLHGKEIEGSGIGLAIVRHIAERHGGSVWAHAIQGEGATFYVYLPRQKKSGIKPGKGLQMIGKMPVSFKT